MTEQEYIDEFMEMEKDSEKYGIFSRSEEHTS